MITTNNIAFQNTRINNHDTDEKGIAAFTMFEVFPRFSRVDAGTISNYEVNFEAMFSGTNQWDKSKYYVSNVYVTIYDKENPINSKIYQSNKKVPVDIDILNTEYWSDETSTFFTIKDGKAYHKYITQIPAYHTCAIRIRSSFEPSLQNMVIDWGDGTRVELSSAAKLQPNETLSDVLGSADDGSKDIVVEYPSTTTSKNDYYSYTCYHDYMPAMVADGIVGVEESEDGTKHSVQLTPDKPYTVLLYGTTFHGIGGSTNIYYIINPEDVDVETGHSTRTKLSKTFSANLISRVFDSDL